MMSPGWPTKPVIAAGYHLRTSARDSVSVCLPIASPVASPRKQPATRSSYVMDGASGSTEAPSLTASLLLRHIRVLVREHPRAICRLVQFVCKKLAVLRRIRTHRTLHFGNRGLRAVFL